MVADRLLPLVSDGRCVATCAVPGCERHAIKRGWCSAHYQRWRKYGDPTGSPVATCWRCQEIAHLAGTDHLANIAARVGLQLGGDDKRRREAVLAHLRRHGRGDLADRLARLEAARQEGAYV